jgi:ferredoxin
VTVSRKTLLVSVNNLSLQCNEDDNLLNILNANNLSISQSCGANATCTTCRVLVVKGIENCGPRTEIESERAEERGFAANERLACQTQVLGDIEIEILNPDED